MQRINEIRKEVTEYCIENKNAILNFDKISTDDKEHIYNIATSIVLTKNNILPGGGFVNAVIENKFDSVVALADSTCILALKLFMLVRDNIKIKTN